MAQQSYLFCLKNLFLGLRGLAEKQHNLSVTLPREEAGLTGSLKAVF